MPLFKTMPLTSSTIADSYRNHIDLSKCSNLEKFLKMKRRKVDLGDQKENSPPKNWKKCFLCQEDTKENIVRPTSNTRKSDVGQSYKTLCKNIAGFSQLGALPFDVEAIEEDNGSMEKTLLENGAVYHKSCSLKISSMKLDRERKRRSTENDESEMVETRAQAKQDKPTCSVADCCFFCGEEENPDSTPSKVLRSATTSELDAHVRSCAERLCDKPLLRKLASGDMVTLKAKYHAKCLTALYNKCRLLDLAFEDVSTDSENQAFTELVSYVERQRETSADTSPEIMKMSDLSYIFANRLEQLGCKRSTRENNTRLKEKLLSSIPDLHCVNEGREVYLAFNKEVGRTMRKMYQENNDELRAMMCTAEAIRDEIFENSYSFNGSFNSSCNNVPQKLLSVINMILEGPDAHKQSAQSSKAANSISQLIVYNIVKHTRDKSVLSVRHSAERETALPIYLGIKVHSQTKKKGLIDTLHQAGLSIPYKRVMSISTALANSVCTFYEEQNIVCPPKLCKDIFTTAAVDNIDHNCSSTTSNQSFHGTAISITQHCDRNVEDIDTQRPSLQFDAAADANMVVKNLPENYTNVPKAEIQTKTITAPPSLNISAEHDSSAVNFNNDSKEWLDHAKQFVSSSKTMEKSDCISWAGYHAQKMENSTCLKSSDVLLPLFSENSNSVAMIKHTLDVVQSNVNYLNPGQPSIVTMDQPLFALAKIIQWTWPQVYGENKFVIIFGGLHIEIAAFRCIGQLLENSGWISALVEAGVTTAGRAASLLNCSNLRRTRRIHEVTAVSLYVLQHKAYGKYLEDETNHNILGFSEWCFETSQKHPQFQFWALTLEFELLILQFIRSIREGNFKLYVAVLEQLVTWFFALDRTHYSRWLPVHIRDMKELQQRHPDVHQSFLEGKFVSHKTSRKFSGMALDQAHEQLNSVIKGDGGAIGILDNPNALKRWAVAGPEVIDLIDDFERQNLLRPESDDEHHHEAGPSQQHSFLNHVLSLTESIDKFGNPFEEAGKELLVLDSKDLIPRDQGLAVYKIKDVGASQYAQFVAERLLSNDKKISEPLPRNGFKFFSIPPCTKKNQATKLQGLQGDCNLFAKLYIACQTREGNLAEFFSHENQGCPPSLSKDGHLRLGNKSEILQCIAKQVEPNEESEVSERPAVSSLIIDGAAIVHLLRPGSSLTFQDYADKVFIPYIKSKSQHVQRVDLVWDVYRENSIKQTTRESRGTGARRRVEATTKIPCNWDGFLQVDSNKTELFQYLSQAVVSYFVEFGESTQLVSTYEDKVLCTVEMLESSRLARCTQEEADGRMMLHVEDQLSCGHSKIMIRTVDSDVVVLAVATYNELKQNLSELWLAYGSGKHFRFIPAHLISNALGPDKSSVLPLFHAFSGCDVVSSFLGKGKKSFWETWESNDEITGTFLKLMQKPEEVIPDECLDVLERFVVQLYDKTLQVSSVNEARMLLFTQSSRTVDRIPPTRDALVQHCRRAILQAVHIWGQARVSCPELPCPSNFGWEMDGKWKPRWITTGDAASVCRELVKCMCKKGCSGRCKCKKSGLKCSALCFCRGACSSLPLNS